MAKNMLSLKISKTESGFYKGFNAPVSLISKILVLCLIVWAVFFQNEAYHVLDSLKIASIDMFGGWYIYVAAFYMIVCLFLAVVPKTARIKLGQQDEKPEFSNFSWLSMMFGAGIGVGMLTFATAEPIYHFSNNPEVIKGLTTSKDPDNVRMAFKWAFFHYGLTAWGIYAMTGLALAYFSYNRGLPLTFRSGLYPLFGRSLSGPLGTIVDIAAILATIIGIGVTIGFGVSQFASGLFNISSAEWLMRETQEGGLVPSLAGLMMCLALIIGASILSALSGVGRGIKWLSNINMGLSIFMLIFFAIFGATLFAVKAFAFGLFDYLVALPVASFTVWKGGAQVGEALKDWQGAWSIFYWAWWIAFAPFVGLFLSRVSRGRSLREYIFGAMLIPSLICFVWFALLGGTAIDLELSGVANGGILNADISARLFETLNILLTPQWALWMSVIVVVLLLTYLVTSADSAVLVIKTIASAGDDTGASPLHIVIWGVILGGVIAALLLVGGLQSLRAAMIVGALPFSFFLMLTGAALVKALLFDE